MKPQKSKNNSTKEQLMVYAKYSSIAFQMIAIILIFLFSGYQLDKWIQFKFPIFTVTFSIIGSFLSLYSLFKDINKL